MSDSTLMLIVAAYPDPEVAQREFDVLVGRVVAKEVSTKGMILVAKDAAGKVVVADTGNELGRKGAGWGAGVGVLVGLFSPAMLATVTVGAAAGAVVGRFAGHKLTTGIQEQVAELDAVLPALRRGSPEHRPHPRHQLPWGEGLGDVVVDPDLEPPDLVLLFAAGGEEDDGHGSGALRPPQPAQQARIFGAIDILECRGLRARGHGRAPLRWRSFSGASREAR